MKSFSMTGQTVSRFRMWLDRRRCLPRRQAIEHRIGQVPEIIGADERTRTADLLITNQLLYQLSYVGLELTLGGWRARL